MDLYDAKDRIAVALTESIFRRARYRLRPFQNEPNSLRFIRDDWSPSFHAWIDGEDGHERDFLIEVTYRPFVEQFIALENQRRDASVFLLARHHWPTLRSILVTDHPDPGRSCFQAVVLGLPRGEGIHTVDLADAKEFAIFPHNVTDHEELLTSIFAMLSADKYRHATRV